MRICGLIDRLTALQVGDAVIYLRRGHAKALESYADQPGMPRPPYVAHPQLAPAVACEVLEVMYLQPRSTEPHQLVRLHVRLRVCASGMAAAEADEAAAVEAAATQVTPSGDVPRPATNRI